MSFYIERNIKSTRKIHQCIGCGRLIEIGSPTLYCSWHWDGDFLYGHYHHECREVELAVNKEFNDYQHDEFWSLGDILWEGGFYDFIQDKFPEFSKKFPSLIK